MGLFCPQVKIFHSQLYFSADNTFDTLRDTLLKRKDISESGAPLLKVFREVKCS